MPAASPFTRAAARSERTVPRENEVVLFGGVGALGHLGDNTGSISEKHPVVHIRQRDNQYWLPSNADQAFVCVELTRLRQVTRFRFRNRHSKSYMPMRSELWRRCARLRHLLQVHSWAACAVEYSGHPCHPWNLQKHMSTGAG